ncbi:restriction endonuclease subunit S [Aliarcobacter butzleri]
MKSNYKPIGDFIKLVDIRNKELKDVTLVGVSINKRFIPSVANIIGSDMTNYKIIKKNQFACSLMQVRRDGKIPVALFEDDEAIISQAYPVFEIVDKNELLPQYLMMWMTRSEFDREACFYAVGGVRGSLEWEDFCAMQLPVPSIEKQKEIIKEYNTITDRIKLNEQLNQKLEDTAQSIYKEWFVNFEFPDENGKPYKSSGGEMVYCEELEMEIPKGWRKSTLSAVANILMGQSPSGDTYNQDGNGEIFYQGKTEFGFRFPTVKTYTTEPKRMAKKGDILMSVRAPVGDVNIAEEDCCIGRGVGSLSSKIGCNSFVYYLMQNIQAMFNTSNDGGTVFGSITKDELHSIQILQPLGIVIKEYENVVQGIDKQIKLQCNEIQLLEILRETLLSKMATIED